MHRKLYEFWTDTDPLVWSSSYLRLARFFLSVLSSSLHLPEPSFHPFVPVISLPHRPSAWPVFLRIPRTLFNEPPRPRFAPKWPKCWTRPRVCRPNSHKKIDSDALMADLKTGSCSCQTQHPTELLGDSIQQGLRCMGFPRAAMATTRLSLRRD